MKNLYSRFIRNTQGFAITLFLLILIPLCLAFIISSTEIANINRMANKTVNYAVTNAVKSAAMMVDPESQAHGKPHIAYTRAFDEFIKNIKYSLMLDDNGRGLSNSPVNDTVKYWLIIYNGDSEFKGYNDEYKVASYAYFTSEGGTFSSPYIEIRDDITGFPFTKFVTDNGLSDVNGKKVTLDMPGVIAVIQVAAEPIILDKPEIITRWACGKLVKRKVD